MSRRLASAALALLVVAAVARAQAPQPAPVQAQPQAPAPRAHHALGYDERRERVILTAGSTPVDSGRGFRFFDDLWEFDGVRWTALSSSGRQLSGVRLAWDSRRGRLLSFGGYWDGLARAPLRAHTSEGWTTLHERAAVPAAEPGFVYDAKRDRYLAFGGSVSRGVVDGRTWEWRDTGWVALDVAGPPGRAAHAMAYDAKRGRTVVFGGIGGNATGERPVTFGDTWEFDGQRWQQLQVQGPSPRNSPGMAYDSKRGVMILFGGASESGFAGDTWQWDGREWKLLATTGPDPRGMGQLAYDARRDRVVLFGGRKGYPNGDLGDTWEWDGARWTRVASADVGPPFTAVGSTFLALSVANMATMSAWYREKLGMRAIFHIPKRDGSEVMVLQGAGLIVELVARDGSSPLRAIAPSVTHDVQVHGLFKVGFFVDDFDRAVAALRERGITIAFGPFPVRPDQPANVGFRDAEGNLFQMFGR